MKWRKIGKVFDPTQYQLPKNCKQFAQAPQTLTFDEFVRIYFSTRTKEEKSGKYLSYVAYVDMRMDTLEVMRVAEEPAISLGALGCFDEHGIFPMSVLRHGHAVYGYTCGWSRRISVSVETAIGLAISHDEGRTFSRVGDGPLLAASLREPCLIGDGFVRIFGGKFHMWYIFGLGWKKYPSQGSPERIYKIGHAVSDDGVSWDKQEGFQIISDRLGKDECQALPTVGKIDGRYHMFFCYRQPYDFRKNSTRSYRIGHAYTDDLIRWTRDDESLVLDVTPRSWDSDMVCYPHIFEWNGKTFLLYNGNEFGRTGFGLAELEL